MMGTGEYTAFLKSTHKPLCQTVEGRDERMKRGQRDKQTERKRETPQTDTFLEYMVFSKQVSQR